MKKLILIALVAFGLGSVLAQSAKAARGTVTDPYRPPVNSPTGP
ncbi:MAG TPA: hypothetical protein VL282_01550 [Tepidisphaeraceae bacterium]|nr:hypothetical protein [Tepidisphaeraceae bacterium]